MNKKQLTEFQNDYTKFEAQCYGEGMELAVHFDDKDKVKQLGARWKPAPEGKRGEPLPGLDEPRHVAARVHVYPTDPRKRLHQKEAARIEDLQLGPGARDGPPVHTNRQGGSTSLR